MNAPFPQSKTDEFADQLEVAFLWRGRCVQQFAELELILGDCLQLFASRANPGVRVKTGQQIRAAMEELRRLITGKGAFAKDGKSLAPSLVALERHMDWRAHLTHGVISVWKGRKDLWMITLHYRETDNAGPVCWHAIPFEDARSGSEELEMEVRKFRQRFNSLCQSLS